MVTLKEVKAFCAVDHDLDDEMLAGLIAAADEYLRGAVGDLPAEVYDGERANLIRKLWVREMYDDRRFSEAGVGSATRGIIRSMLLQLKAEALAASMGVTG